MHFVGCFFLPVPTFTPSWPHDPRRPLCHCMLEEHQWGNAHTSSPGHDDLREMALQTPKWRGPLWRLRVVLDLQIGAVAILDLDRSSFSRS